MTSEFQHLMHYTTALTGDDVRAAETWYSDTRRLVRSMLENRGFDPVADLKRGCHAFAALSPRVTFNRNVDLFGLFLDAINTGTLLCPAHLKREGVTGLPQSIRAAASAWLDPSTLSGPKVVPFAKAVHSGGNADCDPVLDVWAMRACGVDWPPGKGARAACVDAYHEAANMLGVTVHTIQAAVWIAIRGSAS